MNSSSTIGAEINDGLFEWKEGVPYYQGIHVQFRDIPFANRNIRLALLLDAAELLDHPEYSKPFLDADIAPYGLELWPTSVFLAERIMMKRAGANQRALDLGCGLGLSAMAATLAGWRVVAADHESTSLRFAQFNSRANQITVQEFLHFDWNHPPAGFQVDRVFAADVLYQKTDHIPILRCLEQVLGDDGSAWIADPCRAVADRFAGLALENGWSVSIENGHAPNLLDGGPISTRLFTLHRTSPTRPDSL